LASCVLLLNLHSNVLFSIMFFLRGKIQPNSVSHRLALFCTFAPMRILILNGPNLNLLGKREPEIYGSETFEDILEALREAHPQIEIDYYQSNHEGQIIDRLQATLKEDWQGIILNMGAFTHYSYAIADCLRMIKTPKVEVHISHIYQREAFRHQSVTAPACDGMITGLGTEGYGLALQWLLKRTT
ncbi:MAG: type II 3-dehydroquinate dehydratase, partial [Bacteroidota bacterium]